MASSAPACPFSTRWLSFSLFLLHCYFVAVARSKPHCASSFSCGGGLHNISNPFRLSGDPAGCGDPGFELVCEGKHAVVNLDYQKFFVTEITYDSYSTEFILVYPDLMTGSGCFLPKRSHYPLPALGESYLILNEWATFLNCTGEIQGEDDLYEAVPCLSGSSSTVYVLRGNKTTKTFKYLKDSCNFLTSVPYDLRIYDDIRSMDIFWVIRQGFPVVSSPSVEQWENIIAFCWKDTWTWWSLSIESSSYWNAGRRMLNFITFVYYFPACVHYYELRGHSIFIGSIILAILLHVAFYLLVVRVILVPLIVYTYLAYNYWRMRKPIDKVENFLRNQQQSLAPKRYTYNDIVAITCHFREKLGQGGFGSVFKGYILGRYPVAVKILGNFNFNGEDFINEVSTIGRIHHINVVQLVGFCSEGSKRALIYEYMPNGSLDKYIFSSNKNSSSSSYFYSDKLNSIALGVAKGINYLHHGCDVQILHFDIKPHNILLDQNFTPKISDFGLAKLYPKDASLVSVSAARGTIGYIAPELISRSFGLISHKSDVYSFGMLLMEMAGRRRNVDPRAENSSQIYYPSWIYDQLTQLEDLSVEEFDIKIEIDEMERKLCTVGLWCIQIKPLDRPDMRSVVEMLEGDINNLQMPPKPFFSSSSEPSEPNFERGPCSSSSELSIILENGDHDDAE